MSEQVNKKSNYLVCEVSEQHDFTGILHLLVPVMSVPRRKISFDEDSVIYCVLKDPT